MAKCEVIDLTLSDGDFIQAKKGIHPFLYQTSVYYIKFLLHQLSTTTEIISPDSCMYVVTAVVSQSQRNSFLHWQKLEVSLRDDKLSEGETFTGSSGKTSLYLSKCFQG